MSNYKEFLTLKESSTAEIVEKKSRFIADAFHIENKEEAEAKINEIKRKYYDAKHHCFAFSLIDENNNLVEKCSDDGEPSGTAGAPILNIIKKNSLNNVLIVVTRYFGGILLGTGGLTRAYSTVAGNAIDQAKMVKQENGLEISVEIEYSENEKFKYYCEKNNINIEDSQYAETIFYKIEINDEEYEKLIQRNKSNNTPLPFNIKTSDVICRKFVKKAI